MTAASTPGRTELYALEKQLARLDALLVLKREEVNAARRRLSAVERDHLDTRDRIAALKARPTTPTPDGGLK